MKKIVSIILLVIFLGITPQKINAGIPVADILAIAQRVKLMALEMAKWVSYIKKFKEYSQKLLNLKYTFEHTIKGFEDGELDDFMGDLLTEMTGKIIDGIAYDDKNNKDEWTKIFKDVNQLDVKYQNLKDTDYLRDIPLYKNPSIKEIVDKKIISRESELLEIRRQITQLQLIRESEKEILNKFKGYEDKIEKYGTTDINTTERYQSYSKIAAITDLIDLDILKLNTNQLSLYRIMLENELKTLTNELNETQQSVKSARDEIKNYDALNKGK
jgi:hypothetical protein